MFKGQKTDLLLDLDIFKVISSHFLENFGILVNNSILKDLIMVNSIFEKNIKKF
jgi:hypothetical protein